jgi:nucleoid DNA-binding protein
MAGVGGKIAVPDCTGLMFKHGKSLKDAVN